MFVTDPATRQRLITGLRQLADYLETHPDVPVAPYGTSISVHADHTEDGGKDQVDAVADMLGATVTDDTADGGHYRAERAFSSLVYCVVSIPDAAMQRYDALNTYSGCVTPYTEAISA